MMTTTMKALGIALLLLLPHAASAQTPPPPAQTADAPAQQQPLTAGQLDALVSPIALYPDPLLSEILMASTYPLEVVEADRWVQANKNLQGDALKSAIGQQNWDDSVKSLAATPDVLDMMSSKLDWTQQLGDTVLAQQPDVMDAIQRLRAKAQANNKLASTTQQTVSTQNQDGRQFIAIAPTDPDEIYVPYYDPAVVYGPWPYPAYPPYYWGPPAYIGAAVIATGIAFGTGYALGRWVSGGYRWGGGFNWGHNNIAFNRSLNVANVNANTWTHNPAHRQGVPYNNRGVAAKFGGTTGGRNLNFRSSGGQQVLQPGGTTNRSNVGGTNRSNLGGTTNRAISNGPPANRSLGNTQRQRTVQTNNRARTNNVGVQNRGGGGGPRFQARTNVGVQNRGGGGAPHVQARPAGGRRR